MAARRKLIIIGASAFAEIACEYFTCDSDYEVVAFSVERAFIDREEISGLPVVPFDELERRYSPDDCHAFVAVVYTELNRLRTRLYREAKAKGFAMASYVSSRAFVWRNAEVGENCFIFEDNTVQPFVKVGNNVVLWSGNHIGHHSIVRDNCFIASHAVISGFCDIGENCFLGVNCTIQNNIKVARDCFIGAGTLLQKDTKEAEVYQGRGAEPSRVDSIRLFKIKGRP